MRVDTLADYARVANVVLAVAALFLHVAGLTAEWHGKRFGDWTVQAPDALPGYAGLPIVISSFRAEQAIARSLRERLQAPELVLLYA